MKTSIINNENYIHGASIPAMHKHAGISVESQSGKYYFSVKRIFDVVSAFILLVLLFPFLAFIAILIKLSSPGPVIYKHPRMGKYGKTIKIYKFRTMVDHADQMLDSFDAQQIVEWNTNFKLENDPRVTKLGRFLRISSLDELPQLWNIIRGDLSVVGPRPIVKEELERYGDQKEMLLSVRPGLTGYWQAYARGDCSYQQRMQMELSYVKNANLSWDIRILFATIHRVICRKGAK